VVRTKTEPEERTMGLEYTQNLIRRSRLIMPANERKYVEKAHLRNADAVVLDLEESGGRRLIPSPESCFLPGIENRVDTPAKFSYTNGVIRDRMRHMTSSLGS
jgi:hypothetical protein